MPATTQERPSAQRTPPIVERVVAVAERAQHRTVCERLRAELGREWTADVAVVVAGEPKQGKSSLINALLGAPDLLPADPVNPTTAAVVVRHGPALAARVMLDDEADAREIDPGHLSDWAAALTEQLVRTVELELDNPLLATGITLVDTPGVGGLASVHGRATLEALAFADALLFVSDATAPLSISELEFLSHAAERIDTIIFVLTKIDAVAPWREIRDANEAALAAQTGNLRGLKVMPVSSLAHLRALSGAGSPSRGERELRRAGVQALADELTERVSAQAGALRQRNLMRLARTAISELELADRATSEGDERLKQLLAAESERLRSLDAAADGWPQKLTYDFYSLEMQVTERLGELHRQLVDRYDEAALKSFQGGPEEFAEQLQAAVRELSVELDQFIQKKLVRIVKDLAQSLSVSGSEVDPDELGELRSLSEVEIMLAVTDQAAEQDNWVRRVRLMISAAAPATTSAVLFRYIGLAAPIPVVLPVGIAIGAAMSLKDYRQLKVADRVARLRRVLNSAIAQVSQTLSPRAADHRLRLRQALEQAVRDCIAQRRSTMQESIARLEARGRAGDGARRAARERLAELASLRRELDRQLAQAWTVRGAGGIEVV